MLYTAAILGLLGLSAASPLVSRDKLQTSASTGFHLIVNVTDRSRDLADPVHRQYLNSIHMGPPYSLLGAGSSKSARVFYQNGTRFETTWRIVSDGGKPEIPYGIKMHTDGGAKITSTLTLEAGPGRYIGLTSPGRHYLALNVGLLAFCREAVPYYGGKKLNILKRYLGGNTVRTLPKNCAPVELIPQCAKLNDLGETAISSHKFAQSSECYSDVSDIDWSKYPSLDWDRVS
ncbi:hypothetical protein QQS21_009657 [Conoideocrella luteorostrata]|uniref:DUF7907 domain-containing protein n=1 Tax=Conoideocrella luteorostrata TaxID=1105319 RepID=A0AAJ0CGS7_9HYPO|nr:hypothetical protein QQS21_009657 [Conoideocrella luteorostrata]